MIHIIHRMVQLHWWLPQSLDMLMLWKHWLWLRHGSTHRPRYACSRVYPLPKQTLHNTSSFTVFLKLYTRWGDCVFSVLRMARLLFIWQLKKANVMWWDYWLSLRLRSTCRLRYIHYDISNFWSTCLNSFTITHGTIMSRICNWCVHHCTYMYSFQSLIIL